MISLLITDYKWLVIQSKSKNKCSFSDYLCLTLTAVIVFFHICFQFRIAAISIRNVDNVDEGDDADDGKIIIIIIITIIILGRLIYFRLFH